MVSADTAAIYRQTELARQMLADDARGALPQGIGRRAEPWPRICCTSGAAAAIPKSCAWPSSASTGRATIRAGSGFSQALDFWHHIPWLYAGNHELDRGTYLPCFRLILERCDPNVIGGFNRTVLHEVAAMGDHVTDEEAAPFATALLDAGARMDVRDDILKSTPLGWACRWGRGVGGKSCSNAAPIPWRTTPSPGRGPARGRRRWFSRISSRC